MSPKRGKAANASDDTATPATNPMTIQPIDFISSPLMRAPAHSDLTPRLRSNLDARPLVRSKGSQFVLGLPTRPSTQRSPFGVVTADPAM